MARTLQDGIALFQQGDLDGASLIFHELLEEDPENASAHLWMGNCSVLDGDWSKAKSWFQNVLKHGNIQLQEEARRQIWSIWYNRLIDRLVLNAPLRYLLFAVVIGYVAAYLLRSLGMVPLSAWVGRFSVYGLLPLFFIWAMFIISYFVGNIAFESEGAGTRSARIVIGICGLLVFPANFLVSHGVFVLLLALLMDIFLISLLVSRLINWFGRRLAARAD